MAIEERRMTLAQALKALGAANDHLPEPALRWILDHWDVARPALTQTLARFARGSARRSLPAADAAAALPPAEPVSAFDIEKVRARLAGEPPWTAAAVIARLPAAQAVARLDLYDLPERAEIVKRLSRPIPLLASDAGVDLAAS